MEPEKKTIELHMSRRKWEAILERVQRQWDAPELTPEQRAEAELMSQLDEVDRHLGLKPPATASVQDTYVLISEVARIFKMKPKAIKGFCTQHNIPTDPKPRRFFVALVAFTTAYARATNVRTDKAVRKSIERAITQRNLRAKLDPAVNDLLGMK